MKKIWSYFRALFDKDEAIVYKATAWFFFCNILQKGIRMFTIPIFARIMTEEEMGRFTIYQTWTSIVTIITTLRLDYSIFNKGMSKFSNEKKEYTSTMMLFTSGMAGLWFLVYLALHEFINSFTGMSTLISSAIFVELIVVPGMWFWSLNQRYEYKYKSVVLISIGSSIIGTLASVIAVARTPYDKVYARVISAVLISVIFSIVAYIISLKNSTKHFDWKYIQFALKFNIPLLPHYFSEYVLHQSDKIMIQKMVGEREVGLYGVAHSIASAIQLVTTSISNAILPWQYENMRKKNYVNVERRITGSVYIVTAIILLFIFVAPEVLWLFASEKYMQAVSIIPPISCSVIMIFYYCLVANIEFFLDQNKFVTIVSILCALLNIGINFVGINLFGYIGAAYATYVCYSVFALAHILYTNRIMVKMNGERMFRVGDVLLIIVATTVCIIVMSILYRYTLLRYIFILLLAVIVLLFRKNIVKRLKQYLSKN